MKKVLLAFAGESFSIGAFEYARRLNEMEPILLVGLFMPLFDLSALWSFAAGPSAGVFFPMMETEIAGRIEENINRFERQCVKNGISFRVHKNFDEFTLKAITRESRFADLLILGSETFYTNLYEGDVNPELQDALANAECPLVVVPENYSFPERNVLCYDGSASSVYAIKQFSYLFPVMCKKETLLVYLSEKDETMPDEQSVQELAARHYPDLTLFNLHIKPRKYFELWVSEQKGAVVVAGSFGRSFLSQIFTRSFVSHVVAKHTLPIFVAHKC